MLPGRTLSTPAHPRGGATTAAATTADTADVPDTDRAQLLARARGAALAATLVPAPDPGGALAELDALLDVARRGHDPGLRALLLRLGLVARVLLASDPAGRDPADPSAGTAAIDTRLDELFTLVAEHGLSLVGVDAQVLLARRALLEDDDHTALAAVSTALSHLEEPVLVDQAPTVAEHRHNLACTRRLAASTLVSLGVHDLAEPLLDQVEGAGYERVRLELSWGLRLERSGRPGGARLRAAAELAVGLRRDAAPEQRPLLRAASVLGREHGPATTTDAARVARRDAAALARERPVPSRHDRLLVHVARARALERAGDVAAAVGVLEGLRACRPRGEAGLVLSVAASSPACARRSRPTRISPAAAPAPRPTTTPRSSRPSCGPCSRRASTRCAPTSPTTACAASTARSPRWPSPTR